MAVTFQKMYYGDQDIHYLSFEYIIENDDKVTILRYPSGFWRYIPED
jgi:hypothetical protein